MKQPDKTDLPLERSRTIIDKVREELARRRLSRQYLADAAKISLSTLEKALTGHRALTIATTIKLEQALGISLRPAAPLETASAGAPRDLGAYTHQAVTWIEGSYVTLRPSFGDGTAIFAYLTKIHWDPEQSCLVFQEAERFDADFTQHGVVSVPNQSGHFYLITCHDGQYRLAILGRPSTGGRMYGLLATLRAGQGPQLTPIATGIALVPEAALPSPTFGRIHEAQPAFATYREILDQISKRSFADFLAV